MTRLSLQALQPLTNAAPSVPVGGVWVFNGVEQKIPRVAMPAKETRRIVGVRKPKFGPPELSLATQYDRLMRLRQDANKHSLHPIIGLNQPVGNDLTLPSTFGASAEHLFAQWWGHFDSGYGLPLQVRHLSLAEGAEWGPMVLAHVPGKLYEQGLSEYPHRKAGSPAHIVVRHASSDAELWYGVHYHKKTQQDRDHLMLLAGKRDDLGAHKTTIRKRYPGDSDEAQARRRDLYEFIERGSDDRATLADVVQHVTARIPIKSGDVISVEPETLMMLEGAVDAFFVMDAATVPLDYDRVPVRSIDENGKTVGTVNGLNDSNTLFNRGPCLHFEGIAPDVSGHEYPPSRFPVVHEASPYDIAGAMRYFDVGNARIDGTGFDRRHNGEGTPRFTMDIVSLRPGQRLPLEQSGMHFVVNMAGETQSGVALHAGIDDVRSSVIPAMRGAAVMVPELVSPHGMISLFARSTNGDDAVPMMILSAVNPV